MKRLYVPLIALLLSSTALSETWKWNTKIERVRSFNNSNFVCFEAEGIDRPYLCFDLAMNGGKERFAMLLAAKMSGAEVQVSYYEPGSTDTLLWLEPSEYYWNHHFYMK